MEAEKIDAKRAEKILARCRNDLVFHVEHVQGVSTLEPYQRRIIDAVTRAIQGKGKRRIAISACHDVGKTWTSSKVVLACGSCFPGAKIITTAPSWNSVEKLLWSEIRSGHRTSKYPLGGRMLNTEWKIRDDWFAEGISPKEDASEGEGQGTSSGFQGRHGQLVIVIFDEATGIPPKRWIQAEGMMTSANVVFIAIGNPTSRSSPFFRCFSNSQWEKIYLSCFDSPNLTANGITDMEALVREYDILRSMGEEARFDRINAYKVVQEKLLTAQWVMEKALDWGLDHPLFVSKVLGRFPDQDDHTLLPLGIVERAQLREYAPTNADRFSIGVDVARFGTDKSVIKTLQGPKLVRSKTLIKADTNETAGAVMQEIEACGSHNIVISIDGTGVGAGVVDKLRENQRERKIHHMVEIREVNFGEGFDFISKDRENKKRIEAEKLYVNRKAYLFVQLANDLKQNLVLPDDSVYLEELPTIIYKFDSKGRYVIESKDEYKKRTGRGSPDDADALALANDGRYESAGINGFTAELVAKSPTIAPGLRGDSAW